MKTSIKAGFMQLVCVSLLFGVAAVKRENYDAVLLQHNISFTQPDPDNPFVAGGSNLYFTDPSAQINTNTEVFFSLRWGFKGRDSGQWLTIKQPNFAHATFSM